MPFDGASFPSLVTTAARRSQRREDDQRIADLLIEGGIAPGDVYVIPDDDEIEDILLSDDGEWSETWGRPLRRWSGFPSQAQTIKLRRGLFYAAFAAQRGIESVRQIRLSAPVCTIPLTALRRMHADISKKMMDRLRDGKKRYAPGIAIDMVAAHVKRDGHGCVYLHFHLVTRGGTFEELCALRRFITFRRDLPTGWDWWDDESEADGEDDSIDRHPAALVQYTAKGLAAAIDDDWTPDELAELFRQTRGVALVRPAGEFRQWIGDIDRAGMTVKRGKYGTAEVVPKRPATLGIRRHKEKLFKSAGFSILRRLDEYDFGDGIRRRAWLLRGHVGLTVTDIGDIYILDGAPFTVYAPIAELVPAATIEHHQNLGWTRPPPLHARPD
ncbi:hypothetical protein [Azospirillum griseum]|uniref:Uncharacterized protein n=1 Tax=Azospirillum griseum TaxID=2496639 RepID=A0A431VKZ8_9PROT|nr:hypothetical protein [Azospirillum griseum]RTR23049.1 hypothetical protein EJ903_05650 [Azospirillum griseum]